MTLVIPRSCKAAAEKDNLSPYDIEVLDVWLGDCDTKWIMCRHNKADVSQVNFVERFGRLPVGMRDHVRHVVGKFTYLPTYPHLPLCLVPGACL